jgi:hypothetical protein
MYTTLDKRVAVLETQTAYQKERDDKQDVYIKESVTEIKKQCHIVGLVG